MQIVYVHFDDVTKSATKMYKAVLLGNCENLEPKYLLLCNNYSKFPLISWNPDSKVKISKTRESRKLFLQKREKRENSISKNERGCHVVNLGLLFLVGPS